MNYLRESFAYTDTTNLARLYIVNEVGGFPVVQNTSGRRGAPCLRFRLDSNLGMYCNPGPVQTIGLAVCFETIPTTPQFLQFNAPGTAKISLTINTNGTVCTRLGGSSGTLLGTSEYHMLAGKWYQLAVEMKLDASAGYVKLYWNGNPDPDAGCDFTGNTGTGDITYFDIFGNAPGSTQYARIMDVYGNDDTGSYNTGPIGDARVTSRLAVAPNGANNGLTCSSGTNRYAMINETIPDDGTTTISDTAGTVTSIFPALDYEPATIYAVGVQAVAQKSDSGTRMLAGSLYSTADSTVHDTATQALTQDWLTYVFTYEQNPATSAAFTKVSLEACELGVTVS